MKTLQIRSLVSLLLLAATITSALPIPDSGTSSELEDSATSSFFAPVGILIGGFISAFSGDSV